MITAHTEDALNVEANVTGKAHGIWWAEEAADYQELANLASRVDSTDITDVADCLFLSVRSIDPRAVCDDCEREFWAELFDGDASVAQANASMRAGFVEGALDVWHALRAEV